MSMQRPVVSASQQKTQKKGGKEEPEGAGISIFAHGSGSPSGVVEHGRKNCQTGYSNFHFISSSGLQEEMEIKYGLIT